MYIITVLVEMGKFLFSLATAKKKKKKNPIQLAVPKNKVYLLRAL